MKESQRSAKGKACLGRGGKGRAAHQEQQRGRCDGQTPPPHEAVLLLETGAQRIPPYAADQPCKQCIKSKPEGGDSGVTLHESKRCHVLLCNVRILLLNCLIHTVVPC